MNGTVRKKIQVAGGINEDGEPTPATVSWGDSVPCKYQANTLSNKGVYDDGEFTQSEYSITVKDMSFNADQIRLLNSREKVVCEKRVLSLEVLEDIRRVKITI